MYTIQVMSHLDCLCVLTFSAVGGWVVLEDRVGRKETTMVTNNTAHFSDFSRIN